MGLFDIIKVEFKKIKRTRIPLILCIIPFMVVFSGMMSLKACATAEYTSAWKQMFIQGGLMLAYMFIPMSAVVIFVMLEGIENNNNGILKMLALPISRKQLALAKFIVASLLIAFEFIIIIVGFSVGSLFASSMGVNETYPLMFIIKWCVVIFLLSLPSMAIMWAITVLFDKPIASIGINFLLIIPSLLVANTSLWNLYPYCYAGRIVACNTGTYVVGGTKSDYEIGSFLPIAIIVFVIAIGISMIQFGKKRVK